MNKLSGLILGFVVLAGCATPGKKTVVGAGAGAAAGALAGAVIGHQSGEKGKGAVIGAVAGGVIGGAIGNHLDKQAKELEKVAETKRTEEGIVTTLKSSLLFESGSAELKPAALNNINEVADILKKYPENIIKVVGHADNRGKPEFNQTLSLQRAQSVKQQLVKRGIAGGSLEALGKGSSQPIASNDSEEGRAKNRRVELNITVDESKIK